MLATAVHYITLFFSVEARRLPQKQGVLSLQNPQTSLERMEGTPQKEGKIRWLRTAAAIESCDSNCMILICANSLFTANGHWKLG